MYLHLNSIGHYIGDWWNRMPDEIEDKVPVTKFPVSTAMLIFLMAQTVAGVWWAAGLTENIRNLNQNVVMKDTEIREQMKKLDEKISEKELKITELTKSIQTLREMYFLQFGRKTPRGE